MIAPLKDADIDIFVILHHSYFQQYDTQNGGPAGLLDLVKRVLLRTYTKTPDISRDGQAVTIRFEDFVVDVIPCFNRLGGGYLIPNSITQKWISTDPKKHIEIMSTQNRIHDGQLVPLIKMLKAWNRKAGKYLHSFHLEVLALEILSNVTISDYASGARYYFDHGRKRVTQQNVDPAGLGGDVGNYINTQEQIQEAAGKFETAYERAIKAEDFARQGMVSAAVEVWRKIFGDYFPAYGY